MFQKTQIPILGIVENMSVFVCPECGHESHIFGHGGARDTARTLNVPFLGEIPLVPRIRETSDAGTPIVAASARKPRSPSLYDARANCRGRNFRAGATHTPNRDGIRHGPHAETANPKHVPHARLRAFPARGAGSECRIAADRRREDGRNGTSQSARPGLALGAGCRGMGRRAGPDTVPRTERIGRRRHGDAQRRARQPSNGRSRPVRRYAKKAITRSLPRARVRCGPASILSTTAMRSRTTKRWAAKSNLPIRADALPAMVAPQLAFRIPGGVTAGQLEIDPPADRHDHAAPVLAAARRTPLRRPEPARRDRVRPSAAMSGRPARHITARRRPE